MAQTEMRLALSFSLSAKNWAESKEQSDRSLCPVFGLVSALRLLSSVAVPSARVSRVYHSFLPTLGKGDISTLQKRGHFYFGLT